MIDVELLQINSDQGAEPRGPARAAYAVGRARSLRRERAGRTSARRSPTGVHVGSAQADAINWFGFTIPSSTTSSRTTPTRSSWPSRSSASPRARRRSCSSATGCRSRSPRFNTSNAVGRQHRADHLLPVPGRRHQDRHRAARAPQPGGDAQAEDRGVEHQRLCRGQRQAASDQPIIGTRTIESVIRLQDGETNFLAGLIRTDKSECPRDGIPVLGDIPIIGRLFSKKQTDDQRTDVILTLTPHIIRIPDITEEDLMPIWVGTEANITFRGGAARREPATATRAPSRASPDASSRRCSARRRPRGRRRRRLRASISRPAGPRPTSSGRRHAAAARGAEPVAEGAGPAEQELVAPSDGQSASARELGSRGRRRRNADPSRLRPGVHHARRRAAADDPGLRATSPGGFPGGTLRVRFDPSVAAAVSRDGRSSSGTAG